MIQSCESFRTDAVIENPPPELSVLQIVGQILVIALLLFVWVVFGCPNE